MNSLASMAPHPGPLPTIFRQYRSIAASPHGRLSARADMDGTLCLQFYPRGVRAGPRSASNRWRAGPLRTCHLVFEALSQGLALLGEQPSRERSLQLCRLIDRPLFQRLTQYLLLNEGEYERLTSHVAFTESPRSRAEPSRPPPIAWLAASIAGSTLRSHGDDGAALFSRSERETFVLVRQQKRWELWARMERVNSGSMPCRRHEILCSTDLAPEEPALAAELLLYATLARRQQAAELLACPSGVIAPARLALIERQIAQLVGACEARPANA